MGLLDLFTGNASKKAARENVAAIQAGQTNTLNALGSSRDSALGLLGTGTGAGGGNALSALGQGYGQARNDISTGYAAAAPALGKLGSMYDGMVSGGQNAFNAYLDGSGANGAEGSARATDNFRSAPGYEFARDQALEAVQRSAAARGGLAGGNTTSDILKTATGLADQGYQQYLGNLKTGADYYQTGLAGQGQGLTAQANAAVSQGTQLGALGTGLGAGQAGLYGSGANVANSYGTNAANAYTGATNQTIGNNNNLAASENAAGANILGALLGGAQMISGKMGSSAGAGAGSSPTGGANFSPFAGNPFMSGISRMFG